ISFLMGVSYTESDLSAHIPSSPRGAPRDAGVAGTPLRGPIFQRWWLWVPSISASTRVFDALCAGTTDNQQDCVLAAADGQLFDGVDLVEDRVRPDFLGVSRHHRVDQLLHLGAVRESDALELASLLQRVELGAVFGGLDLSAISAGFLAGLDDGRLQLGRKLLEGLARETDRPDRDRVLRHREIGADLVELHLLDAGGLVLARRDDAVLDGVVDFVVRDHGRRHADG